MLFSAISQGATLQLWRSVVHICGLYPVLLINPPLSVYTDPANQCLHFFADIPTLYTP